VAANWTRRQLAFDYGPLPLAGRAGIGEVMASIRLLSRSVDRLK
jgi:hypothetical protein